MLNIANSADVTIEPACVLVTIPAFLIVNLEFAPTATGTSCSSNVLLPICPESFLPQAYIFPLVV